MACLRSTLFFIDIIKAGISVHNVSIFFIEFVHFINKIAKQHANLQITRNSMEWFVVRNYI